MSKNDILDQIFTATCKLELMQTVLGKTEWKRMSHKNARQSKKAEVVRIVHKIDNAAIIESIYSFIMGMLSVGKGGRT